MGWCISLCSWYLKGLKEQQLFLSTAPQCEGQGGHQCSVFAVGDGRGPEGAHMGLEGERICL